MIACKCSSPKRPEEGISYQITLELELQAILNHHGGWVMNSDFLQKQQVLLISKLSLSF